MEHSSQKFLNAVAHPPTALDVKVPDRNAAPSVAVPGKLFQVIGVPNGLPEAETWSLMIVDVAAGNDILWLAWSGSDMPDITDPALVKSGNLSGNMPVDTSILTSVKQYRMVTCSVTCKLIAPLTASQGTVAAGQWASRSVSADWAGSQVHGLMNRFTLPQNDDEIASMCTRPLFGKATEGSYVPLKTEDDQRYVDTLTTVEQEPFTGFLIHLDHANGAWEQAWPGWFIDPHFNNSIQVFRGLSTQASVSVRREVRMELCVGVSSPWRTFITKACNYDPQALNEASVVQQALPDALEAKYNDLGDVWNWIKRVVPKVWHYVKPVLGLVPEFAPFIPAAEAIGKTVNNLTAKKQPVPAPRAKVAPTPAPRKRNRRKGTKPQ